MTVLELGSFIAGPFAGQILGDFGADVIKVEPPHEGDPMRSWGVTIDGESLWWPTIARNKSSICVDLHDERGIDVIRKIAAHCDVVLENFRPGRLDEWGLNYESLCADNPKLIMVHVSGYGQSGPRSKSAGFGSIGEAMGGLRYVTGNPNMPPSRTGISIGDEIAASFAVMGTLAALVEARGTGVGQEVDVAIYEAVAAMMESTMADFALGGVRRERTGSTLPGIAPSNAYPTAGGVDVVIAANGNSVFARLCEAMGSPELASDERFRSHKSRGINAMALDEIITAWTKLRDVETVLAVLDDNGVPAGRIYSAEDMLNDEQYAARDMVRYERSYQGWTVPMSGVVPKFSRTPGTVRTTGPKLGAHTYEVITNLAGVDEETYRILEKAGVVWQSPPSEQ